MIPSGDDYPYLGFSDGNLNVALATADGSNPRIDLIVAYVDLAEVDDTNPNNPDAFVIDNVSGTPSGSPAVPNNAAIEAVIGVGNPYIILARVAVGAGVTTITNANVTDVRVLTTVPAGRAVTASIAPGAVTTAKVAVGTIVETVSSTNRTATSTTYASMTDSIELTAGTWEIWYSVYGSIPSTGSNTGQGGRVALSSNASTVTHPNLVSIFQLAVNTGDSAAKSWNMTMQNRDIVQIGATTTFTLIARTVSTVNFEFAASIIPTVIKARKISDETP
jgi:hypothetical protein